MNSKNIIVIFIVALIIGLAMLYIIRQKKKGAKCIGCPYSSTCGKKDTGCNNTKHQI